MDRGPCRIFDVGSAAGREEPGRDKVVEGQPQIVQRPGFVSSESGRMMLRGCESRVEEAWLCAGEVEVRGADGSEPESCTCRRVRPRTYLAHAAAHALSESPDRLVADRREERITVGEVSVGSVRNNPHHSRHLAQYDRVRSALPRELHASVNER